ncbi:rho guanine nucleotide exchange factor 37-like [Rhincodon typus]|uniref:rho guanine nucleotide exchange factor 37-like n=1 Tax=Rhincodon typus TaxID=259920 RepID=UPI00202F0497|nr:rho guanine nucleotide exchange factor 37-like [Rhincodon typus]
MARKKNIEGIVTMDDSSYEELSGKFTSASKMEEKQMKAIKELVETEKRYLTLLHLCATDIRNHLQFKQVPDLDLEGLFGGTDEVLHVSSNLLKNLEDAATGKSDQVLLISNVFLAFKRELEDAYKEYCANYENMLQLETNYKKNEIIWKEVAETLNEVGAHTGAITLTFFLVTPVQRIGKYPLLLKTILENTAPSDEGYTALEKATVAMQEVNYNINEYKRLKEVVTKYSRQENLSLRDTIGRINKHSIAKKASRLSQVIKHETGILPKPYNEEKLETLLKKYSPEKIYQVTSNVSGNKELDLTLQRGDLVALLQATDTRGNTNRWLVDSGGHRGFVPGGKLSPLQPGKHLNNFPLSQCSSVGHIVDGAMSRRKSSPSPERPLCLLPEPMQYEVRAFQLTRS